MKPVDLPRATESTDDLSALAWVNDELRRSLDAAHKSLRRYLKEAEAVSGSDVDAVDPGVLRHARAQIHQGVGALELVGLPAAATLLRASETALSKLAAQPRKLNATAVDAIEHASFGLLEYLARLLARKPVSSLALFPQYRALQVLAGADRAHPAELWSVEWQWRDVPAEAGVTPLSAGSDTRTAVETQMLDVLRQPHGAAAMHMSDLFAGLAAGSTEPRLRTLWQLAAAFFEGQAQKLVQSDVYSKRVGSRLLAQLRVCERGDAEVSDRLAHDLLFFCAQAASPGDGRGAPRLAAVRQAFGLVHATPVDYEDSRLGRFDPAIIVQARKRVAGAKDAWSAVAGGELHRLSGLSEQFSLVGDSLRRLYPQGDQLADALLEAVQQTAASAAAPSAELAMEVATSMLYLDASLEDAEFDHPEQAERAVRMAQRIAAARQGTPPAPLEGWMEDLYRRVSDRQTMGSVVQELRSTLGETEKLIDQYFRNPSDRQVLIPVPGQLQAMRGVLSVLGLDQASQAILRMRDDVDALTQTEVDPHSPSVAETFERLAGNLGALGFLIDMLSVQPQMAKSLFVFDAFSGNLRSVVGGGQARVSGFGALDGAAAPVQPHLIEQAQSLALSAAQPDVPVETVSRELERLSHEALIADQSELAETVSTAQAALQRATGDEERSHAVREEIAEVLADFVQTASRPMPLEPEIEPIRLVPMHEPKAAAPTGSEGTGLEDDAEMREIFIEEAREVIGNARAALAALADTPDDVNELTTVRRAFHTLKGSSRMVGLKDFGEAAWGCEQLYNARLAEMPHADEDLQALTSDVLTYLADWIDAIEQRRDGGHQPQAVAGAAERLRLQGERVALPLPGASGASGVAAATLAERVPDLPQAADLDLSAFEPVVVELQEPATSEPVMAEVPSPSASTEPASAEAEAEPPLELPSVFDLQLDDTAVPEAPMALPDVSFDLELAEPEAEPALQPESLERTQALPPGGPVDEPPPVAETIEAIDLDFGVPGAPTPPAPAPEHEHPTPTPKPPPAEPKPEPEHEPKPRLESVAEQAPDPEQFKTIGPLSISIPLFNIFLSEADELSRRLSTELAEWALELHRPVGEGAVALAHSLAGNSATVGFTELSQLARALEHALMRSNAVGEGHADEASLFVDVAEEVRRLLHQFAAGFLKSVPEPLWERLAEHERLSAERQLQAQAVEVAEASTPPELEPVQLPEAASDATPAVDATTAQEPEPAAAAEASQPPEPVAPAVLAGLGQPELKSFSALPATSTETVTARADAIDDDDDIDAVDAVDAELFPIFEEEGQELLPQLASRMRDWARRPTDPEGASACMRTLHTLKGGARLAGAMRLGEMAHRLETAIEHLVSRGDIEPADLESLQQRVDALQSTFEALRSRDEQAYRAASNAAEQAMRAGPAAEDAVATPAAPLVPIALPTLTEAVVLPQAQSPVEQPAPSDAPVAPAGTVLPVDWSRFSGRKRVAPAGTDRTAASQAAVRVRAPLLDRLVNHAGEVSITRSRIESGVNQLKGSLGDLTENLERLRRQLRDIELQAETQITSRMEAAKASSQEFDPLEFDRFTRFQELTRMMAESVNDVATVQRSLQRTLQSAEDELAAQARLTRDLQDDLLRTRMVEFEGLSDRLYRVVRLAAKETGKQVRLDILGGSIEVDRGVLDRMTGAFEHLLRNCVTHGIEAPQDRTAKGKDATGQITVVLTQEGNEVGIEFRDDGAGLQLDRIRAKGVALGILAPEAQPSEQELAGLIFTPGFSTADQVTELAGRGIGMDVVRSEVNAMGGRIETATAPGQGTSFRLVLPLTTAVTQVVMLRCGPTTVAVPSTLIEIVRRAKPDEVARCYERGQYTLGDRAMPFFWLGALLQSSPRGTEIGRTASVVVAKSAQQRVALHVDEVLGNHEVVVKNLGSQMARLPGLAGMTLLASGAPALIYNPVALATLYGESAWALMREALVKKPEPVQPTAAEAPAVQAPLVLVVDDSLTVRRVTQRLLAREGYRVTLAKDGLEGLERLAEERPAVLLSDIEMPRMDGFDLVRNLRNDVRLADLPVIMITSRIAQKHRDYAAELGVDHYLGKPYSEEDLLALVARYAKAAAPHSV